MNGKIPLTARKTTSLFTFPGNITASRIPSQETFQLAESLTPGKEFSRDHPCTIRQLAGGRGPTLGAMALNTQELAGHGQAKGGNPLHAALP